MAKNLSLSIALAYLNTRRRQTLISTLGVAMGVGFFIAVSAMMAGFQNYFVSKIVDVAPHILMKDEFREAPRQPLEIKHDKAVKQLRGLKPKDERRGIRGGDRIVRELERVPGLRVAPVLNGEVFVRYGSKDLGARLVGIVPEMERRVSNLERDLIAGSLNSLLTNSNGIILGAGLAKNLGARLNSKITVVSPEGVILVMKVVGIVRTGITTIDYSEAYALLKKSQILQQRENRINQIKMRLSDIKQAEPLAAKIEARFGYRTEGWQETNENVFSLFRMQNIILYSVVSSILVVAGFGIFNIISTVVNEKVRDIAILKSIGFSARDIERMFLLQGLIVGLMGTLAGWLLSLLLMHGLEQIPFDLKDRGIIDIQRMVVQRSVWHFAISGVLAILAAAFSSYLPARKAAQLNPVDILRGAA